VPLAQPTLYLAIIRLRELMPNAFARHGTGQLMQAQSNGKTLLARHLAIPRDLQLQSVT